jgi:hypothetical protein
MVNGLPLERLDSRQLFKRDMGATLALLLLDLSGRKPSLLNHLFQEHSLERWKGFGSRYFGHQRWRHVFAYRTRRHSLCTVVAQVTASAVVAMVRRARHKLAVVGTIIPPCHLAAPIVRTGVDFVVIARISTAVDTVGEIDALSITALVLAYAVVIGAPHQDAGRACYSHNVESASTVGTFG